MRTPCPARALALALGPAIAGCAVHAIDRWDGRPVVRHHVAAPADSVWSRIQDTTSGLGLVVAEVHPERRIIEFDWVTAPGAGRLYLRCDAAGAIGSASLKARIQVVGVGQGSVVIIGTRVRATVPVPCESTGQFESWLLDRLEPAITTWPGDARDETPAATPTPATDRLEQPTHPEPPDSSTAAARRSG